MNAKSNQSLGTFLYSIMQTKVLPLKLYFGP